MNEYVFARMSEYVCVLARVCVVSVSVSVCVCVCVCVYACVCVGASVCMYMSVCVCVCVCVCEAWDMPENKFWRRNKDTGKQDLCRKGTEK